jgi:acetyl esterase/lipase
MVLTCKTAAHIEELGVSPTKGFLVGGISAGGNFSTVVSHLYRDEGLSPPLTGVYLSIPSTRPPEHLPEKYKEFYLSREQNKNAPVVNNSTLALLASKFLLNVYNMIHGYSRTNLKIS